MKRTFQLQFMLLSAFVLSQTGAFAQNDTLYTRSKVGAFKLIDRGFGFLGTSRHHNRDDSFTNFVNYHAAFALWVGAVNSSGEMRVTSGNGNALSRRPEWAPLPETFQINTQTGLPAVEKKTAQSYYDGLEFDGHKPLSLSVEQNVFGFRDGKYAIIDFAITIDQQAEPLKDYYFGFWGDIDAPGSDGRDSPDNDKIGFSANGKALYVYDSEIKENAPLLGAMVLGIDAPIISWWKANQDPKNDAQQYYYLRGDDNNTSQDTPGDYRFLLSYGPISLSSNEATHFLVALTQANDINVLEDNFAAAQEFFEKRLEIKVLQKKMEASLAGENMPLTYQLYANFPNPFNPTTEIRFDLPEAAHVRLRIYDLLGRTVRNLIEAEYAPGKHHVVWDGRDDNGLSLPSAIYLYEMRAGNFQAQQKLLLLK